MLFVCIASGPTLTVEQVESVRDRAKVIVVNDGYRIAPWADHLYAADTAWWVKHNPTVKETFDGEKWVPIHEDFAKKFGLRYIPCRYEKGLGRDGTLHCGHHSGYQAINLAVHLGATKIILLGYEMKCGKEKKNHWFGVHRNGLRNEYHYEKWIKHYAPLAEDLKNAGIDIVNCSTETAITTIRRGNLEEELSGLRS